MRFPLPALLLIAASFYAQNAKSQTILLDDFTRADNTTVGNGWSESETTAAGAQISNNRLLTGSTTAGREWVFQDVSANYTTNGISSNAAPLHWAFNFRQTRPDPSGFDGSNYGIAFCLGSTSSGLADGSGYAVVIGQSGSTDPIRLASFSGGMNANSDFTNIISGGDYGTEYLSVLVTYDPNTDEWALFAESSGAGFPQSDPRNTSTQIGATTVNTTYTTGNDLRYLGCLWNHATGAADNATFDDIYIPSVDPGPVVGFETTSSIGTEGTAYTVNVVMSNYAGSPVTVDIAATNGTAENGDYTLNNTSLVFNDNGTQTVDIDLNDDADYDDETFTLNLTLGAGTASISPAAHMVTIDDDDTPPNVGFDLASSEVVEGNAGTTDHTVDVTMESAPATTTVISVARTGGTATTGVDFNYTTTNLTFDPADTYPNTQSVTVGIIGDIVSEPDETLILGLSVSSGAATISALANHTVTITNDDVSSLTFYSTGDGNFTTANIWNTEPDGSGSSATYPTPGLDDVFIVQTGHTITVNTGDVTANGITVDGTLNLSSTTSEINLNNPGAGAEFVINGTFIDNASTGNGANFLAGATWEMGSDGTLIKSNTSSSNVYQENYEGGISTIPATANWILRYVTTGANPNISSINAYYPNLIVESNNGNWNPATAASRFQGSSGTAIIKGDLDVGGTGSGTVTLYTQNTNANPISVEGSMIIRSGSTFTNNGGSAGTGVRVAANVTVDGTLDFSAGTGTGNAILEVNGTASQDISGSGTINLRNFVVNKSGTAFLNRDLTVTNQMTLTNGYVQLGNNDLTVNTTISGGAASTFVITDDIGTLIQPVGGIAKNYPVGNSSYNPISLTNTGTSDQFSVRVADEVLEDGASGAAFTESVVNRTWLVEEAINSGSNLSMTVQWNAFDELDNFDRSACYVSHYTGGGWNADAPGAAGGFDPYTRMRTGITSLSPFSVGSGGILPVELAYLKAVVQQRTVLLFWETKTERDNEFFAIERSTNGQTFSEIGRLVGAGDSFEPRNYTFTDQQPFPGINYYRLRQVDFGGAISYSPVVTATLNNVGDIRLFPSPATDFLKVQLEKSLAENAVWEVFDQAGRLVLSGNILIENTDFEINTTELPDGVYTLRLTDGRETFVRRFQKNK